MKLGGRTAVASRPVAGGYTQARREVLAFDDGATAFVKTAVDAMTAQWLRQEAKIYDALNGAPFLPERLAFVDGEFPALVLEDLSGASWPRATEGVSPWTPARIESVLSTLAQVRRATPPAGLPPLTDDLEELASWERVAADPEEFLALGLCTPDWLEAALPDLVAAERAVVAEGESLCHVDVRSDNLCFLPDGRCVLVDWNWARRGNGEIDIAGWLPSLQAEGGPLPETILPDAAPWAALLAGFWAQRAGAPPPPTAPQVRVIQKRQLGCAFPWAIRALGLPPPG